MTKKREGQLLREANFMITRYWKEQSQQPIQKIGYQCRKVKTDVKSRKHSEISKNNYKDAQNWVTLKLKLWKNQDRVPARWQMQITGT